MNKVFLGKYFTTFVVDGNSRKLCLTESNFCTYRNRACMISGIVDNNYIIRLITDDQEDCIEVECYE